MQRIARKENRLWLPVYTMISLLAVLAPTMGPAEEIYRFKRMWPALQQPWYFAFPGDIVTDHHGNVYLVDTENCRIQKFTSGGQFITKWGSPGSDDGQFIFTGFGGDSYFGDFGGIALDAEGNVYVADTGNFRIQKFSFDGQFIAKWGSGGLGAGEFYYPMSVAVSSQGTVYVVDFNGIQTFTADGVFLDRWESVAPTHPSVLYNPKSITVDSLGNVYLTDSVAHDVKKYSSDGKLMARWGGLGGENGKFNMPKDVTVDAQGYVYVSDNGNHRIQKFTPEGKFIDKCGKFGAGHGEFNSPVGICVDASGNIYVGDYGNHRIQKFAPRMQWTTQWGAPGSGNGQFRQPDSIAVDGKGNVYVAETANRRVQKFTSDGRFISKWGSSGKGEGQFQFPRAISVDAQGYVYVVDTRSRYSARGNCRIQKFTSEGQFILQWGSFGQDSAQFMLPWDIAVDCARGDILVLDRATRYIKKFTADGQFIAKWELRWSSKDPLAIAVDPWGDVYVAHDYDPHIYKYSSTGEFINSWGGGDPGDSKLDRICAISVDQDGNLYVIDHRSVLFGARKEDTCIKKFTPEGQFITRWGGFGSGVDQMHYPEGISIGPDRGVYVADTYNHRIQVFTEVSHEPGQKAIIVAGSGPHGNPLWDATARCANFAYRSLNYQGFTKESLYYLSSDTDLDLDENGVADDVDANATNNNLHRAITEWAKGAERLIIYLTGHGGEEKFIMRSEGEVLSAGQLDSWLNLIPDTQVIVVYDGCHSGSFLGKLSQASGDRVVIASARAAEDALFGNFGSISFSDYFWTQVFNGSRLSQAYSVARKALHLSVIDQHPLMDANGNGLANEGEDIAFLKQVSITNEISDFNTAPQIESVSPARLISGTSTAKLYAEGVTDGDGIARVWAMIRPPAFHAEGNPIAELPQVDLAKIKGTSRYEGTYSGFTTAGTYQIAIHAMDRAGNTTPPSLTKVSIESPLARKAILVAGGPRGTELWPSQMYNIELSHRALLSQGYGGADIKVFCPHHLGVPVDGAPTLSNLRGAIEDWAADRTYDLVLYLIGDGGAGTFRMNPGEMLSATELSVWLSTVEQNLPDIGRVVVIYDACRSGSFLPELKGGKRILISSARDSEGALFLSKGLISFSQFFWAQVLNGANVFLAFHAASGAIDQVGEGNLKQTPQLDDNGNGIANEFDKGDGAVSWRYTIGSGIGRAAAAPVIGSVSPDLVLGRKEIAAVIWAGNVTTTGVIVKVFATIVPPGYAQGADPVTDLPEIDLIMRANGNYRATYSGFTTSGVYEIIIFAVDGDGNVSSPRRVLVTKE